jgi:hypothetical protein
MCYALNGYKGIHSTAYAQAVTRRLEKAVSDAKGRNGVVNHAEATANIIAALGKMKVDLEKGKVFW